MNQSNIDRLFSEEHRKRIDCLSASAVKRVFGIFDPELHKEVCETISAWMDEQPGWQVVGVTPSPITGPEGNVEFLIGAVKNGEIL